jgi:preprotein translocase subunit SecE
MAAPRRRGVRLKFFGEVVAELRKATWPTRQEAIRLTIMVIIVSVSVGLFLGAIDYGFTQMARLVFPPS